MRVKIVSLRAGRGLDWAVAKAASMDPFLVGEDVCAVFERSTEKPFKAVKFGPFHPSTDWAQGGPFIDKMNINFAQDCKGGIGAWKGPLDFSTAPTYGPDRLTAAMRCYATSQLGETVEIPEGLF